MTVNLYDDRYHGIANLKKALNTVLGRQDSTKGPNSEQDCRAIEHGETSVDDVRPCAAGPAMTASADRSPRQEFA